MFQGPSPRTAVEVHLDSKRREPEPFYEVLRVEFRDFFATLRASDALDAGRSSDDRVEVVGPLHSRYTTRQS
jgi:hypothetical protein